MKLVQAKCPNCGGTLQVDPEKDAAICEFCKTPFVVEKAINNYNTTIVNNNTFNDATVIINNDDQKRLANYLDLAESAYLAKNFKDSFGYSQMAIGIDGKNSKAWDLKVRSGINLANLSVNEIKEGITNASKNSKNPDAYMDEITAFIINEVSKKNLESYVSSLKQTNESLRSEYKKRLWGGEGPLFLNPAMAQYDNPNIVHYCGCSFYISNLVVITEYQRLKKLNLFNDMLLIADYLTDIYKLIVERMSIYGRSLNSETVHCFKSAIDDIKKYMNLEKDFLIKENEKMSEEVDKLNDKIELIKSEHPFDGGEFDKKIETLNEQLEKLKKEKKALGIFKFKEKSSISKQMKETKREIDLVNKEKQNANYLFYKENSKYYQNESAQIAELTNWISKNNQTLKTLNNRISRRL